MTLRGGQVTSTTPAVSKGTIGRKEKKNCWQTVFKLSEEARIECEQKVGCVDIDIPVASV